MSRILVIIPAYNEADNIENVITDLQSNFGMADCLVINDCSTDETVSILDSLGVNHIDLPVNLGIGGGVQTGYRYALENDYDIAVQFDGDGQHDAAYLELLVEPLISGAADVAIGSRFLDYEGFQSTALRRTGIRFLSSVIKVLSGVKVKDVTSGMRAVNRRMIEYYAKDYAQDYPEPEALLTAGLLGVRITEIPVKMRSRQGGESSISPLKSVYYMIKVTLALLFASLSVERNSKQ